jgi:uncharacterized protein (DUF58 family)
MIGKFRQSQTVAVYPDLMGLRIDRSRSALPYKISIGNNAPSATLRHRYGIRGIVEYGVGDDIRLINWKLPSSDPPQTVRVLEPERETNS